MRLRESLRDRHSDECSKKTKLLSLADVYLCQLGDQQCVAMARELYSMWMQNEDPSAENL
jgi:hypothetical protein